MKDRNGKHFGVGSKMLNIPSMAVDGVREGVVESIDGAYVHLRMNVNGTSFLAERYNVELEVAA